MRRPYVHDVEEGTRDVADDEERDDGQQGDARLLCHLPAQRLMSCCLIFHIFSRNPPSASYIDNVCRLAAGKMAAVFPSLQPTAA